MPLVTCPDCGRAVSDAAPACPGRGRPIAQPAPPAAPAAPAATSDKTPGVLMLCAAGLVALGSFLPWAKAAGLFGGLSRSGMQGDGVLYHRTNKEQGRTP